MPNKSAFSNLNTAVALASLILFFCTDSARAQISPASYTFVVASGFLCDTGDSGSCPAVSKSANGDSYEISGAGAFDPQNKSVKAAGTFNHKSTSGIVLETGVWIASDLISFDSYGIDSGALRKQRPAPGPQRFGSNLAPNRSSSPVGGLAVLRVRLLPLSGITKTAMLQLNCALGAVPRERSVEGIRLSFEKSNSEFSEEVSGHVIFLASSTKTAD